MIEGQNPIIQALLGTLLTWGLTALGAAVVFVLPTAKRSILDASLGFAGGVMTAASFWSLLAPAIEMATESGTYGAEGQWAFAPVALGFFLGALFVFIADVTMSHFGVGSVQDTLGISGSDLDKPFISLDLSDIKQRRGMTTVTSPPITPQSVSSASVNEQSVFFQKTQWKRIILMIVAITVHNIPEGLAVGVGFGAIGKTPSATFLNARNLALGIGIQNFPEGMAVSLPLRSAGYSVLSAFFWGQLSGMVEPLAGILGAFAVNMCTPILPYALAFAAGAMIFVVVDDIIPEAHSCENGRLASFWCIGGFITMMMLDVGLG